MRCAPVAIVALCASCLWGGGTAAATSGWVIVPGVNPGTNNTLRGVAAISANDVWAVGSTNAPGSGVLIEHWDGTQWSLVSPAVPPNLNSIEINGVAAAGSHDVWLVGSIISNYVGALLTEHWNGTTWTMVPASGCCYFTAITHDSGPRMIVVGQYYNPMAQEWNGSAWIVLPPPVVPAHSTLSAITASPTAGVWSVGSANHYAQTLILHGNVVVPSPNTLLPLNYLSSVSVVPGTQDVWAVGADSDNVSFNGVLIEYYSP